jgi:hypothetical protein
VSRNKYRTSLYAAILPSEIVPQRLETRNAVWEYLKKLPKAEKTIQFLEEEQLIYYKKTTIQFRVLDAPSCKLYLLSFSPTGEDRHKWGKTACEAAAENTLSFCDEIGPKINIQLAEIDLAFKQAHFSTDETIDISNWEISCPYRKPPTKENLVDFLAKSGSTRYESVFQCIPGGNSFYVFTDTYLDGSAPFPQLKKAIIEYGQVLGPKSMITVKEFAENFNKEKSAFIFLESARLLETWYREYKIFFDSNRIPTQYLNDTTISQKITRFAGVRANLILEMLTKMDMQPIILQAPEEIFVNDGFLCLSDLVQTPKRLFGALFTYSKQGLRIKGEVQIYDDIEFETPTTYSIEIPQEKINLLAQKICSLIGRRLKIDIILTKTWKKQNIEWLTDALRRNGIETEKVYYLSGRTCRFVDDYLQDSSNYRSFSHPYFILNGKIATLKTATETRIYPNLFSLYAELVWPDDAMLTQGDLEKILWLIKKRIYRIQEFHVLKRTEPAYIFGNLRKMYLGEIKERLKIPLRLLI